MLWSDVLSRHLEHFDALGFGACWGLPLALLFAIDAALEFQQSTGCPEVDEICGEPGPTVSPPISSSRPKISLGETPCRLLPRRASSAT
jgi:hypothetical protein